MKIKFCKSESDEIKFYFHFGLLFIFAFTENLIKNNVDQIKK